MKREYNYKEQTITLLPNSDHHSTSIVYQDKSVILPSVKKMEMINDSLMKLSLENSNLFIYVQKRGDKRYIFWKGRVYEFSAAGPKSSAKKHSSASGLLISMMPCQVVRIAVKVGDKVVLGQEIVVVEAMKTVQSMAAPFAGVVKTVFVAEKQLVVEGASLVELVEEAVK